MGFEPQQPCSHVELVNEFAEKKAKDEYAQYYNWHRTPAPEFNPGDMVWLDHSDIKTTRPSAKFGHRQLGPYRVERKIGANSYRLALPPTLSHLHPVFPIIKLSLAEPDPFPGHAPPPPPPPVLVAGEEEFKVEQILNNPIRYRRLEYLIKWKGYDASHNSWIAHYILPSPNAIADFYQPHPGANRLPYS